MRIALVSPYSWTYQGGVNRHVEALAEQFLGAWRPRSRARALGSARRPHAAACTAPRRRPASSPTTWSRSAARSGSAPTAPSPTSCPSRTAWCGCAASCASGELRRRPRPRAPGAADLLGRQHLPGRPRGRHLPRLLDQGDPQPHRQPARRPPDLQPALGPDRGLRGRRLDRRGAGSAASTRSSPTGSTSSARLHRARRPPPTSCACCSSAAPRSARACRSCSRPSRRWSSTCPPDLTVVGADPEEVARRIADPEVAARIDVARQGLRRASSGASSARPTCSVAPSLAGESFGMVLIEAMASGTPLVASQIAGYSDVVTDGVDGVLVPPADPQALAEELQRLWHEPERRAGDGRGGTRERRALRLAAGRRRGHRGLRARDGARSGARSTRSRRPRAATGLDPPRRRAPAPGEAAPVARAGAG